MPNSAKLSSPSMRSANVLCPASVGADDFAVMPLTSYTRCSSTFFGEMTIAWSRRLFVMAL